MSHSALAPKTIEITSAATALQRIQSLLGRGDFPHSLKTSALVMEEALKDLSRVEGNGADVSGHLDRTIHAKFYEEARKWRKELNHPEIQRVATEALEIANGCMRAGLVEQGTYREKVAETASSHAAEEGHWKQGIAIATALRRVNELLEKHNLSDTLISAAMKLGYELVELERIARVMDVTESVDRKLITELRNIAGSHSDNVNSIVEPLYNAGLVEREFRRGR